VAEIVGTINNSVSVAIIASWHLKPCKITNPEIIFGITEDEAESETEPVIVTVWGSYDPDIDYTNVSDWQEFRSAVTIQDQEFEITFNGNIIDRRECYFNQAVSIPIPPNISLVTVTVETASSFNKTYRLIFACKEE